MDWIYRFVIAANLLIGQGYSYDLGSGLFVGPAGDRIVITCCPAPPRGRK